MNVNTLLEAWTFPAQSFNRETPVIKAEKVHEVLDEWLKQLQQKYETEDLYTSRDVIRALRYDLSVSSIQEKCCSLSEKGTTQK